MEIQHFSHKHPLILDGEKIDDDSKKILCDGCRQSISGSAYRCTVGCYFHLHKLCAGLPAEFQAHPLHQEHPLILLPKAPYEYSRFGCDACDKGSEAFTYHCSVCNFDLDVSCAMRSQIVEHESHKHPLRTMLSPALVDCHACGTEHRGFSYQCDACKFWIHEDCASLPTTIKHDDHVHFLTLSYSLPEAYIFQSVGFCSSCIEELYKDSWCYWCEGCKFVTDVNCSNKTRRRKTNIKIEDIDDTDLIHLPVPYESDDQIGIFIKQVSVRGNTRETYFNQESVILDAIFFNQISLGGNNKREAELNNYFSHNHPLTLFNLQSDNDDSSKKKQKDDKICNVYVQPIPSTSFYGCSVCDFFIHKWCAELPPTLQHPCHPHPLILVATGKDYIELCDGCEIYYNGIGFKCVECKDYFLDVICASLPRSILHEVHEHPLFLREHRILEGCAACYDRSKMFSYGCAKCSFTLHYKCAMLPRNIRHRYDEHPFTLNYAPIKDGPNEYICEFCEEDVDPKWWFYHCIDCDKSACASCIYNAPKEYRPERKWWET